MANNIDVKDAAAASVTLKTTDTAGVHTPHHNVDSSALPTGAATSAKQDTQITAEQAIQAAVEALDAGKLEEATFTGRIGEVQASPTANTVLDRLKALLTGIVLAAGTNAIGKLAANSGVDIGDVDVTSIAAGDNNIGNVDVVTLPALAAGTNAIGKLLPPDIDVTAHTNYAHKYYTNAGAVTDGIVWSPAAGKRWHVTSLYVQVSAAATVTLEDDKAGGDDPVLKAELAANSGIVMTFEQLYPLASGEDAADLLITTSAGNVYVTVVGYEI